MSRGDEIMLYLYPAITRKLMKHSWFYCISAEEGLPRQVCGQAKAIWQGRVLIDPACEAHVPEVLCFLVCFFCSISQDPGPLRGRARRVQGGCKEGAGRMQGGCRDPKSQAGSPWGAPIRPEILELRTTH